MKFKRSNATTLFLDPYSTTKVEYDREQKVNIILSPALYWVKKLSLPVKYVREVKKLLPSIFEESLPAGHYSYSAYKSGDDFFIFAYEDKKIIDLLSQNEINAADIAGVYFAQSELSSLEQAVRINETQSLYIKDELLLIAPSVWFSESTPLDLSGIELSRNKIKLQQYGHIVDNSSLYKIGAILAVLALILFIEIVITTQKRDTVLELKDELFSKYKLQSTMMQNQSTLEKYEKIHASQSKLREYIAYFLTLKLETNQKIELMEYKNGVLLLSISGVVKGNESKILAGLQSKAVKPLVSFSETGMKVEIKI
jgi:hypothetical protein